MGQVITLNVETLYFFRLPHLVEVSVFRMLNICLALVMVTFICFKNVSFDDEIICCENVSDSKNF